MCGIVGFIDKSKDKKKIIKDMADLIIHRGPDSDGYYVDDNIALGFRRLSIIDLGTGSQPIFNEEKDKVIIFNGEIYNYQTIKEDLLAKGHKFTTKADTEVILHGYEEYGKTHINSIITTHEKIHVNKYVTMLLSTGTAKLLSNRTRFLPLS